MKNFKNITNWLQIDKFKEKHREKKTRAGFRDHLRPDDVFIVGHPKSGNTWLSLMLATIIEKYFSKAANLSNVKDFVPILHANDINITQYTHFQGPRFFRNEGPIFSDFYPKTIYIVRDPRAAYVSYYHHYLHDTEDYERPIDDFIDELLTYGCLRKIEPHIVRWDRQVLEWIERSKRQPVKIVKYEDLKKDRAGIFKEILEFTGIQCDESDIQRAVDRGSFDKMREEEKKVGAEPYSGTKGERGFFVRKGKSDGWKEEISPELSKRIEDEFFLAMQKMGYTQG